MLNKDICIKCIDADTSGFLLWNDNDDELWNEESIVQCPIDAKITCLVKTDIGVSINEPPPHWCLCKFRQCIAAGMTDAK